MNIAFYISNHGYGHIMRNIPVIAYLLEHTQDKVVLVTGKQQKMVAMQYIEHETSLSVNELNCRLMAVEQNVDFGLIVKPGTLLLDTKATGAAVDNYITQFPERINSAKQLFDKYQISCVVSDVVPWVLTAAKEARIPSVLMASFTWIEQYEEFLPESSVIPFRRCYADADHILLYELANQPTLQRYPGGIKVGLCARPFHMKKVESIRNSYRNENRPIVFVSIGGSNSGIDSIIDVSNLPYTFITTEGLKLLGDNVHFLPVDVENTQDYVAASDFCISKAGWSTIAEMLLAGKPMALLARPDVPEDRMNIAVLVERGAAMEVSVAELQNMKHVLERMQTKEWLIGEYRNDCERIAMIINTIG